MALITYVTDRATGERSGGFQDNTISLSGVSDVRLDIEREDIASWEQKGDDLVVTLQDGTQILIENFYASDDSGLVSRLLVNGDEVIAAPDISSSLLGLGLLGLVGAGAALAGGSDADTTAPVAPADLADATNEDGTVTLTGTAEPGAVVDVTWPDGTTSQVTADENGDFSATSATAQPEGDITATATDASGNASDPAVLAYDADPSADVTAPDAPSGEVSPDGTTLSGTAEPGATVTATLPGGGVITAVADENGDYSIALDPALTGGEEVSVTATDASGNISDPTVVSADDTTPPEIAITAPIEGDNVVNASEDANVVVSGTTDAEDGQTVTVTFTDSASSTVTATATVSGGAWSLSGADISTLSDGAINISAAVSDLAGNDATPATTVVTMDATVPEVAITAVDDFVTWSESFDVAVSGTTDAEDGQTVTVTFTDSASSTGRGAERNDIPS